MWLILQQEVPEGYVIATGVITRVREFVRMAFDFLKIEVLFEGERVKVVVLVDEKYFRPTEVELLIGDPTKSMTKLGWQPKYDLKALVDEMM